ncbi:MAG: DUF2179 domain-containing protein [Anaerolineaceae bacterium]|nr:DUF2179 domain-containing protein [Anaerolineaceae bacterium]
MDIFLSPQAWLSALIIFSLRIADMALDTIRVLFVVRGRKGLVWMLGVFQALVFVLAITRVLSNLDNPVNIIGYALGFATGNYIGMLIEERLAIGHTHLTVISSSRGAAVSDALRADGFAVTEIPARGKNGMVSVLHCNVVRKDVARVEALILETDPEAFVTAEDVRPMRRGFWRA